ncbi:response regulator transcription factor [Eisenbergiella tayi]|mgnify:CR=1 FL=1|uniref:Stage 0 sporulation protein A homolog n=1 Tax=Eisenbergiella porci TaxID=2652274 RepID=A0A6N7WN05_9FIRM|nr:response regulator transcription factor [Eisenbergiella porci]MSS91983.1 response regulator transcription factor [Eisenbergiella porci]
MRLLIIEDEKELCLTIADGLRSNGYEVDTCFDGADGLELATIEVFDLIVLDLNLPSMDGMEVLTHLRQENSETPVLILSARGQINDKVGALDTGANDYLTKPFHFEELEARIRSLTRRKFIQTDIILSAGELRFNTQTRVATVRDTDLVLTRKETGLLEYFMLHPQRIISQEELMDHMWDTNVNSFSNSIRVHLSSLRKKLRAGLGYDPITNKIGQGYIFKELPV